VDLADPVSLFVLVLGPGSVAAVIGGLLYLLYRRRRRPPPS